MKKKLSFSLILIILIGGFIVLSNSLVITQPDEYTLIKEFGKIKSVKDTAGVSFKKPFVQSTDKLPRSIQQYDLSESEVITKDSKTMITDSFVTWKITNAT